MGSSARNLSLAFAALTAVAVETTENGCPTHVKLSVLKAFRAAEIKAWSEQHLTRGSAITYDGPACFRV